LHPHFAISIASTINNIFLWYLNYNTNSQKCQKIEIRNTDF
jgi:hypothetical protein